MPESIDRWNICQKKQKHQPAPAPAPAPPKPELKDEIVETEHSVVINDQTIAYTATTGRMVMKDEEGKPKATIFFIAYTRKNVEDPSRRPLTISFNGGPGSSSVWLHLGLLGPRRVLSGDVDNLLPPPYRLADNDFSLLDVTDLVFVDPVSTGFSRPAPGEEAKQFHGLEQDVESVGEFIRLFVTRYKRWSSPKFLIGESYGTTRASALAGHLQSKYGLYLNGLMLVSVVLNFQTLEFETGNDLPYILYVPAYAATAWYHKRLAPDLQADFDRHAAGRSGVCLRRVHARALPGRRPACRAAHGRRREAGALHRALAVLCRAHQSAHRAHALLQGAAARPAPHRRPARQPLYRRRPRRRR